MKVVLNRWLVIVLSSLVLGLLGRVFVGPKTCLVLGLGSLIIQIAFEVLLGITRPEYNREDFLAVLSLFEWKRMLQIQKDLAESKGVKSWYGEPSLGWLYVTAERLLEEGLIEYRIGTDPQIIAKRGEREYREYRLTQGGQREKDEIIARLLEERASRPSHLSPQPHHYKAA